jgi:hypothetical protein
MAGDNAGDNVGDGVAKKLKCKMKIFFLKNTVTHNNFHTFIV